MKLILQTIRSLITGLEQRTLTKIATLTDKIKSVEKSMNLIPTYVEDKIETKMDSYNPTGSGSFSMNRKYATYAGSYSHTEGYNSNASAANSHAEGKETTASGISAHSEGQNTTASGMDSHAEGAYTTASGRYSHAEGQSTTASADHSHAEGYMTTAEGGTAKGKAAHAEGSNTKAIGDSAHAEGFSTKASGMGAHAEGGGSNAIGSCAHAEGYYTSASVEYAHAEGWETSINTSCGHVQGRHNLTGPGSYGHIMGNGTQTYDSNAHTIDWDGNATFAGSVTGTGADYAEYFEWMDSNPDDEDRVGFIVALDGEKIRLATPNDEILGIISGTAMVLGDNAEWEWRRKYLIDDYGRVITEMVEEFHEETDPETGEVTKTSMGLFPHRKLNPDFDPEKEYARRSDRPEWDTVGILGKLHVRDDGTCAVNGYAAVGIDGIATASAEKTNMRVMKRITDNIVLVLLK